MKLFVGLGNPGAKHSGNRHNVGFMAIDRIAAHRGIGPWRKRFHGLAADGVLDGEKVLLLKPQTYYNEAGRSVGEAMRFLKLKVDDLVVFHDEIDLAPGKLRVKTGGGHAGNNGLRSIISHLSADFTRVRIGVGHPGNKDQVANYVLHDFPRADALWLETMLDGIAAGSSWLVTSETERFLTDVSQRLSDVIKSASSKTGRKPKSKDPETARAASPSAPTPSPRRLGAGKNKSGSEPASGSPQKPKRGQPNQLELARKSARPADRNVKQNQQKAKAGDEATQPASAPSAKEDQPATTALADRLKRWLAGRGSES